MGLKYERPWLKGQTPLELIFCHCLITVIISSENNDWLHEFSNNQLFQKNKFHLIALGSKFDIDVIISTNSVGLTSQMLHTKFQGHWPAGSGDEDF